MLFYKKIFYHFVILDLLSYQPLFIKLINF